MRGDSHLTESFHHTGGGFWPQGGGLSEARWREPAATIEASLGVGMVGGVKAYYTVLLALVRRFNYLTGPTLLWHNNPCDKYNYQDQINSPQNRIGML